MPDHLRVQTLTVDDWIPYKGQISEAQPGPLALQQQIIHCIIPQKKLIVLFDEDQPVACGMGVLEDDLLGFFSIYTHHDARRKGYARAVMAALTDWGSAGWRETGLPASGRVQPARDRALSQAWV